MNTKELEQHRNEILAKIPILAICYDFDNTLSPDDMQAFTLIPSFGMEAKDFWPACNGFAKQNLMEPNLAWMFKLIEKSKENNKPISKKYFHQVGKDVKLYEGVVEWFDNVNQYAECIGLNVEHYIISSGLREIIEGSVIADKFKRIYASSYLYSEDGNAVWPAQAVNYTTKTQFIFRIAKGIFEEYDDSVNDSINLDNLYIPYENFVYIGDSATDIPCMRLVKSKGGYSIAVSDPQKPEANKTYKLFRDKRIDYFASTDYTEQSQLFSYIKLIMDDVVLKDKLIKEHKILKLKAENEEKNE